VFCSILNYLYHSLLRPRSSFASILMSTLNRRASKRRRRRPPAFNTATATEERLLHQAIQNSKLDRSRSKDAKLDIPWGPTFFPTVEEMEGSPLVYIEKIRPIAQRYGICKIVPPKGWDPVPFCKYAVR
jgi:hypothetical protein